MEGVEVRERGGRESCGRRGELEGEERVERVRERVSAREVKGRERTSFFSERVEENERRP